MPYAVIRTGGKQYRVSQGDTLRVEKLPGDVGQEIELDDVLMLADGEKIALDAGELKDRTVKARIVSHGRGPKIRVYKFKRRKGYEKTIGHRQDYTELTISSIG